MSLENINTSNLPEIKYLRSNNSEITYPILKEMFKTGLMRPGLRNNNDEFLDVTALLLIKTHKDKTILPTLVDIIFFRNREGLFTHDLIWAFFQARDIGSLMLIANYLHSDNIIDVKLACKLLDFVPSIDMTIEKDSKKLYMNFIYYLKENNPFLYYTGESFQRTSNPMPYIVALDAKYLCRPISVYTGEPLTPYTDKENRLSDTFNELGVDNKLLLSNYSLRIHYQNLYLWDLWINNSISNQINIAQNGLIY